MWSAMKTVSDVLAPLLDLFEVLLGGLISLLVTEVYFRRQLKLDKRKQKAEVLLRFSKLVRAYKRHMLSGLKRREEGTFPDYVKDARDEYETYHNLFLPGVEGGGSSSTRQAQELAQAEIEKHPDKFVPTENGSSK